MGSLVGDGEQLEYHGNGEHWLVSSHPSPHPPDGTPHGSTAIALTASNDLVLVSQDGEIWDLPGGRPEPGEEPRATLDREMLEEACARVEDATLLGFMRGACIQGPEEGLIIVRSFWRASVSLLKWQPRYEMKHRCLVRPDEGLTRITPTGPMSLYERMFHEALGSAAE